MSEVSEVNNAGLAFKDLGFSAGRASIIPGKAVAARPIIDGISGVVPSGEILFVIGASGSGKTSVLDAIAGLVASSIKGEVFIDGTVAKQDTIRRKLKYVPQVQHLYETLSVEETLNYAASFYCDDDTERADRVDAAISALGLEKARHVKCGGAFYRGLSGGQRRRVGVAIELVAKPAVLLLDEPTTGLDSTSAHAVMSHLRELATKSNISIVCTLHQPTRRILDLSDRLLVLAEGRTAYSGPTNKVFDHFVKRGCKLPPRTNVADWLIDETSSDFHENPDHVDELLNGWPRSEFAEKLEGLIRLGNESQPPATDKSELREKVNHSLYKRSIPVQTALLAKRNVIEAFRNPAVIYLRFVMYLGLAIVIGLGWYQLPSTASNIRDRLQGLGFCIAFFVFMSIAVLPVYLNEKEIVIRERSNASYSSFSYVAGHFVMEVLFIFVMSAAIAAVVYFMAGFGGSFGQFAFFVLTLSLSLVCAESIMLLVASIVPFLLGGIAMSAFIYGAFMVVAGGLIDIARIPWVVRWIQFVSLHTFALSAVAWNDMGGTVFDADPNAVPPIPERVPGEAVLNQVGWPVNDKWTSLGVIVAMTMCYRLLAFVWIHYRWTGKK